TSHTGSRKSRPGWSTSTPIPRPHAPPQSSAALVFRPTIRGGPVRNSPADGECASRSPQPCSRLPTFCCWMSRPTLSISKARQAQSRVKILERMKPVAALVTQDVREISFPAPEKMLSPPIIALDNVSVGYDPKSPVLNRVTLRIDNDDRIALLGANGNGKS